MYSRLLKLVAAFFLLGMLIVSGDANFLQPSNSDAENMELDYPDDQNLFPARIQRQTAPGNVPVVNPTMPGTTPAVNPTNTTTGPTTTAPSGREWCIANANASPTALQVALDYACGYGGADCSGIQPSGPCYDPNAVRDHASYAFNSYYQRNPIPTSCVFGGAAQLSSTDPSYGNCRFASSPANTMPNPPANPLPNPPAIPMTPPSTTNPYTLGGSGSQPAGYDYGNEPPSSAQSISLSILLFCMSYLILNTFVAHPF